MNTAPVEILLIEDNEDDYLIVRDLLDMVETHHFNLEWASCFDDGLQAMQSRRYDVLLVDYRLADRTGVEFLHEVKQRGCQTPVLMLTGQGDRTIDLEAMQAGAADFLDKNELSSAMLERSTRHAIERSRAEEALRRSEERYRAFITNSSEAIWCCEMEQPVSISASEDEQIEQFYRNSHLGECNEAMACLYKLAAPQDLIGARLNDLLPRDNPDNIEFLRSFIRSGYRLTNAESCEVDSEGGTRYFLNNFVGIIENGALQRAWGNQRDITEQKETESMRSQLAAIVEFSHDAMISKSLDGTILSWNRSAERIYGYSAEEVRGQHISLLAPPELRHEWQQIANTINQGGHVQQFETVRVCKDQRRIDVALTVSPIKNSAGEITGASTIARDITERKHAEEIRAQLTLELEQQRQRLNDILSTVPGVVWEAWGKPDANDQRMGYVSDYVTTLLGYSVEEWLATPNFWLSIVHPEDKGKAAQAAAVKFNGKRNPVGSNQFRWVTKDGRVLWVEAQSVAIKNEYGHPIGMRGVTMDITERKQAEEELKHFFTLSLDMLCIAGFDGYFKRLNPMWSHTLGYSNEELLSRPFLDFVHPEDRDATLEAAKKLAKGDSVAEFENRYQCKDGSYKWILWKSTASPDHKVIYAAAHDFTEHKKTELSLRTYASQLENSNRELQDFAYVASHDLQEPLRKIQAFGERLESEYSHALGDEGRDYLERMQNAAGRMQGLIKDLLAFSRVATQTQPFVAVDMEKIAREVICDLETRIEQTDARIEVGSMPSVEADPLQMRQLLQNLIGNGIKFHPAHAAPVVKVYGYITQVQENLLSETPAIDALCHIIVEDNGIGFDEKHLERIFSPFQRLHGRNQYEGTGIGLAICRKIAKRHGGHITARSAPSQGATFIVTLPIKQNQSSGV